MIDKVDQESEEYRKWKEGSVPIEQPQEEPIESESITEEVLEPEVNQSFFDRTFKVKNDTDRMKKTYYFLTVLVYYSFCYLFVYDLEGRPDTNVVSVIFLIFLSLFVALFLPLVLVIMGFTVSGGAFIGIFIGIFSWFFGAIARFIYKLLGFDIEVIFPEFIGKRGEVSKHSLFGKLSSYPFTAEIENMGVYEDSLFYKNRFSIRSDEELKIGTQIEIIKHEKRTLTSLMKNHPTFLVKTIKEEKKEEIVND
tara:strand:+ start:596 stop:1351 length:756 start_codon:yes stop_codon:yes gene_type:complete